MTRPRLLDLYCGAGGAARGYHDAGFDMVGVDLTDQPRYPYEFIQGDVFGTGVLYLLYEGGFDAIHASPPCQRYSKIRRGRWAGRDHADLVAQTRTLLVATGLPYVIENVEGSPLIDPVRLCGSSFDLGVRRHRLFETNWPLMVPPCSHGFREPIGVYGHSGGYSRRDGTRGRGSTKDWAEAMEIDWMTGDELAEAIPPAYTTFIGLELLRRLAVPP